MMTSPVKRLTEFVLAAQQGVILTPLPILSQGELGELERAINLLVEAFKKTRYEKEEQALNDELMAKEMRLAQAIQSSLLPSSIPEIPGLRIEAFYQPAREIGGDYYDFIEIDSAHIGIVIADVSGKSISAAMFMSIARSTLRSQAQLTLSPGEVLERTQDLLMPSLRPGIFVSVFYSVLNLETKKMVCANAGHLPLMVYRSVQKQPEWIHPKGIAMGLHHSRTSPPPLFQEEEFTLEEGDLAFFYTDGLTETRNSQGIFFGRNRLADFFREACQKEIPDYLSSLREKLDQFAGSVPQQDDQTAIVIQRRTGGIYA